MENNMDMELFDLALAACENAYAPYSNFRVGAALFTEDGRVFTGVNVENSSYGATICAERSAFSAAVTAGARGFSAIAIAAVSGGEIREALPCGICRQVMAEFCDPDFRVITGSGPDALEAHTLAELLPYGFSL